MVSCRECDAINYFDLNTNSETVAWFLEVCDIGYPKRGMYLAAVEESVCSC